MKLSPVKLGIIGALTSFASLAWVFEYSRVVSRNDPTGLIVDRTTPDAPKVIAIAGIGCVLVSIVWAVVRLIRRRVQ